MSEQVVQELGARIAPIGDLALVKRIEAPSTASVHPGDQTVGVSLTAQVGAGGIAKMQSRTTSFQSSVVPERLTTPARRGYPRGMEHDDRIEFYRASLDDEELVNEASVKQAEKVIDDWTTLS